MNSRPAACAGSFYPGERRALEAAIAAMLPESEKALPAAMIVPHAGYVYSGSVAANAYARLQGSGFRRIVLIGPAHRVWFRGIALPGCSHFETPLGNVSVDSEACIRLASSPGITESPVAHELEHSLEVQLPFLQTVLGEFSIVPLLVGEAGMDEVSSAIDGFLGEPETLVLASSDLSHFHPYVVAQAIDGTTAKSILELDPVLSQEQACGATAINGLLISAERMGLEPRLIDIRNSGDTAGDKRRVVGYASFSFGEAA